MINRCAVLAAALALAACGDDAVVECDVAGHACTWAGKAGVFGFNGDGLARTETELYWTMDMVFAPDGTAWFIDWNNHLVRHVLADDTVESMVGWVDPIFPGDGVSGPGEHTPTGVLGLDVKLNHPTDLVVLPDGKILIMAWHNHKLRELDPATKHVRIVAGGGAGFTGDAGPVALATFRQPKALERDPADGSLYILDQANLRIRKVAPDGTISTIAGDGTPGSTGDGGPALLAKLDFETGSNPEPSGGLALGNGKLYVADTLANRIRVIDLATGVIDAFAGTGVEGAAGDGGPALQAQLSRPRDMELHGGSLYFADTDNNKIRAIDLATNEIRTVAGTGELGLDKAEGMLATDMKLARPFGIEFDVAGNLYISDTINSRILKVSK